MERHTLWDRLRRVNPVVWDALLAVAVFLASVLAGSSYFSGEGRVEIRFYAGAEQDPAFLLLSREGVTAHLGEGWPALALIAAACAPLVWRRRAPIGTLVLTSIAAGAYQFFGYRDGLVGFPLVVAAYTAAAYRDRVPVLVAALPVALAAALTILLIGFDDRGRLESAAILLILVGLPMLFGQIAYNRRRRIQLDLGRATRDAVGSERARIARELHDVVAHAMGVMVVQAGAGRVTIDRDPAEAATAFKRIEETGRTGLAEMRRLVGILQKEEEAAALVPQPGLDQLDELLERMRQTGLPVEADIEPVPGSLPPGVDLTAYRVIQEALTNALKHGGGARARLLLRFDAEALDVQVSDDGRGPPPDGTRIQGHGLIGMRERVALFGGTLETGERPGRGLRGEGPDPAGGTDVTIRVLIADDQALMRGGFRMILEAEEDIEVVGEAIDGRDALEQFGRFDPDVVVMDIRMPAMDGIEATRRLTEGDSPARVLILTTFDLDEYVYGALRAGASGFLLKDRPPEELVAAVRVVASGEALLAPSVTRRLIEEFAKRPGASTPPEGLDELTDREREVLVLMAQGLSNSEIAGRLFVAETTVKTHVGHVLQKLQLRDRAQAVVVAYESGLVQPSP